MPIKLSQSMPMRAAACAFSILSSFSGTALAASDDAIQTDRPDFVDSSDVVGTGRVQIETSYQAERNETAGRRDRTTTTPTLVRIGTGKDWEVRLASDGRTIYRTSDNGSGQPATVRGYGDLSLSTKWHVRDGRGPLPALAWIAEAQLATGSAAFRGSGVRPSLRLAAEWELPHEWSVGIMPGLTYDQDDNGQRFAGALFGVVLGKS